MWQYFERLRNRFAFFERILAISTKPILFLRKESTGPPVIWKGTPGELMVAFNSLAEVLRKKRGNKPFTLMALGEDDFYSMPWNIPNVTSYRLRKDYLSTWFSKEDPIWEHALSCCQIPIL